MKILPFLILSFLWTLQAALAGLPPTTTKGSGDTSPIVTFNWSYPNIPFTHSGTTATMGAIPNAALANSSLTVAGHSISLGGTQALACSDLTGVAASCSTDTTNAANISSGTLNAARLPNPSATTLGGIESIASGSLKLVDSISTSGVPSQKTLVAGSNITLTDSAGNITISASGSGSAYIRTFALGYGQAANNPQTGCSSDPCGLYNQKDSDGNTDTVASINRAGTGVYTLNITAGRCSQVPACAFIQSRACLGTAAAAYNNTATPTNTAIPFVTDASGATNGCGYIQCSCVK